MDYERPEVYQEHIRRARKLHKCYECLRPIQSGNDYHWVSGIWDGEPATYKTCMPCHILRSEVSKTTDEPWAFGMLAEEVAESDREDWQTRWKEIKGRN